MCKETKYKVGDKVKVREDLELDGEYQMFNSNKQDSVTEEMYELKGEIVTISEITTTGKYHIEEDDSDWNWTDEMFEGLASECKQDHYEVGDVVKIKKWDDMVKEFGTTPGLFTGEPNIESEIAFSFGMKRFCDKEFKIERKFDLDGTTVYELEGCKPLALALPYAFSADTFVGKVTNEEKPKLYNAKVVCISNFLNPTTLTVGKIYEFKDGKFRDNKGDLRPVDPVHNLEEFHNCGCLAKFIEVIE